ncbi:MAG: hypothetical protein WCH85_10375, partial [Methanomicrobiales archaeon]
MTAEYKLMAFVLLVKDMEVSREFYETVLFQDVAMDHGLNVSYKSGLALWQQEYALNVIHGRVVRRRKGNDLEYPLEKVGEGINPVTNIL